MNKNDREAVNRYFDNLFGFDTSKPKAKKVKVKKVKAKQQKKKLNKKGVIVSVVAFITAAFVTACSAMGLSKRNKKNNDTSSNDYSVSQDYVLDSTTSNDTLSTQSNVVYDTNINDLGDELEFKKQDQSKKYGDTTKGKVDKDKIVEKDDKLYVDQNAADKSNEVGDTKTDLQDGKLVEETNENGETVVKEKDEYYEVKDEDGKVVDSGKGEIPSGYVWDEQLGAYVTENNCGKFVVLDKNYYGYYEDENGNMQYGLAFPKGSLVSVESYKNLDKYFTTYYDSSKELNDDNKTESNPSEDTNPNLGSPEDPGNDSSEPEIDDQPQIETEEGVINPDGTYTIYGLTFRSKTEYEQWVAQGYEGFIKKDGIMIPEEEKDNNINNVGYQKVLKR